MKHERFLGVATLLLVLYYYFLAHPPEWFSGSLWIVDSFMRRGNSAAVILMFFFAAVFIFSVFVLCLLPFLIAMLGFAAKKRKDYFYGLTVALTAVLAAWEIWLNSGSWQALLAIARIALDSFAG